jgi:hypothetical protein
MPVFSTKDLFVFLYMHVVVRISGCPLALDPEGHQHSFFELVDFHAVLFLPTSFSYTMPHETPYSDTITKQTLRKPLDMWLFGIPISIPNMHVNYTFLIASNTVLPIIQYAGHCV